MPSQVDADVAEQVKLAAEAYLYGYPLVYNLREIAKFSAGPNLVGPQALPYNTFGYARNLLSSEAHFVSPIMHMCQPKQPILDGSYVLPSIRRVA